MINRGERIPYPTERRIRNGRYYPHKVRSPQEQRRTQANPVGRGAYFSSRRRSKERAERRGQARRLRPVGGIRYGRKGGRTGAAVRGGGFEGAWKEGARKHLSEERSGGWEGFYRSLSLADLYSACRAGVTHRPKRLGLSEHPL